ncbi:MAG TPA: T9SS type A sorting domain-containing protein [Tangfeifania sp.]|nr:T9SS type A sorting domain-containing protein [Tangfeifania sp.]
MKQFILLLIISAFYFTGQANQPAYSPFGNDTLIKVDEVSSKLKIYPNPCSTGQVTLEMEDHEIAEIKVINIAGKEMLQRKTNFGTNKYELKLNNIPKGIYFLRVKTTGNKVVAKKLIVSEM